MQCFLPYPTFELCAQILDGKRLNNQVNEGIIILKTCLGLSDGWANHPAVKMWRGYELCLADYIMAIATECYRRWNNTDAWERRKAQIRELVPDYFSWAEIPTPPWLGDDAFHRSHRRALLAKNPDHYRAWWPDEIAEINYVWPTNGKESND